VSPSTPPPTSNTIVAGERFTVLSAAEGVKLMRDGMRSVIESDDKQPTREARMLAILAASRKR